MKKIILILLTAGLLLLNTFALAFSKPPSGISIYEQPTAKSKVVGSVNPGQPIIPIFSDKGWTKVGDPKTGTVGWISNDVLKQNGVTYIATQIQPINVPQGKGYQVIQYSGTQQIDDKQVQQLMQNWQTTQQNFNRAFNQMINQSVFNLNQLLQQFNEQQAATQPVVTTSPTPTAQPQGSIIVPGPGQPVSTKP